MRDRHGRGSCTRSAVRSMCDVFFPNLPPALPEDWGLFLSLASDRGVDAARPRGAASERSLLCGGSGSGQASLARLLAHTDAEIDRRALTPLPAGRTALAPALIQLGRPTSPWPAARCAAGFFLPRHAPQSGQRHRGVKCFRSRRLPPLQVPACQQARQELAEESPNGKVRFRRSGRDRHHLGHHGRGIVALPAGTADDGRHRARKLVDQSCSAPHVVIADVVRPISPPPSRPEPRH